MNYIELNCTLYPKQPEFLSAFLINGLGDLGFESFDESESFIKAYISSDSFDEETLKELIEDIPEEFGKVTWVISEIEQVNWNAEWEKNFNPVVIFNTVLIKASFHKNLPEYPYEIIVDPKMSFGTGHHATTALMVKQILGCRFENQHILDMGCGTGILAILAHKLGASQLSAYDIDEWAVSNSAENFRLNGIEKYDLQLGGAELLKGKTFDCIFANINRNILLYDLPAYTASLKPGGTILLSGFYFTDLEAIRHKTEECGLVYKNYLEKNSWVAAKFTKS